MHLFDFSNSQLVPYSSYPKSLHGKFLPAQFVDTQSVVLGDSLVVTNFMFDKHLSILNLRTEEEWQVEAGLNMGHIKPFSQPVSDYDGLLASISYPLYEAVFYDQHSQSIFRLVRYLKKPSLAMDDDLIKMLAEGEEDLIGNALIQLNLDLEIVKTYQIPLRKYFIFTEEGIYVEGPSSDEVEGIERYERFSLDQN